MLLHFTRNVLAEGKPPPRAGLIADRLLKKEPPKWGALFLCGRHFIEVIQNNIHFV